jgi:hypothetical protein
MKISKHILLIAETMIPLGLLWISWKLFEVYSLSFSILLLFLYLLTAPTHIKILKKRNVIKATRLKLVFLTGTSIMLCLSLILHASIALIKIDRIGYVTKEVVEVDRRGWVDIGCLDDKCRISKLKSDRVYCAILLTSLCFFYNNRYKTSVLLENPSDVAE